MRDHICPTWLAFSLDNKLRRFLHNPEKFLTKYINKNQTAIDLGCGPGFFTIPMARLVGEKGRVIAVDLQPEMLQYIIKKAEKNNLSACVVTHQCPENSISLNEKADFVLSFYMVHEVPDVERFINEIPSLLKPHGRFLVVEPKMHTSKSHFKLISETAIAAGLKPVKEVKIAFSRAHLFQLIK